MRNDPDYSEDYHHPRQHPRNPFAARPSFFERRRPYSETFGPQIPYPRAEQYSRHNFRYARNERLPYRSPLYTQPEDEWYDEYNDHGRHAQGRQPLRGSQGLEQGMEGLSMNNVWRPIILSTRYQRGSLGRRYYEDEDFGSRR
jgi:hypothetical protein